MPRKNKRKKFETSMTLLERIIGEIRWLLDYDAEYAKYKQNNYQ